MKKDRDPRLDVDGDFIVSPRYNNRLSKLLEANPNGVSDNVICKVLKLTQEELDATYQSAIMKLRKALKVSKGE